MRGVFLLWGKGLPERGGAGQSTRKPFKGSAEKGCLSAAEDVGAKRNIRSGLQLPEGRTRQWPLASPNWTAMARKAVEGAGL
jgi:hypothetical protein